MTRMVALAFFLGLVATGWAGQKVSVAGIVFDAPSRWQKQEPASSFRVAQFSVLARSGESGEVVLFYFGKDQGGDVPTNISRWLGQLTGPDGTPVNGDVAKRMANGLSITQVTAYGTYSGGMAMAGVPPVAKPNYGFSGGILETAQGNIFIRFVGPDGVVKSNLESFSKFLDSAKPEAPAPPATPVNH